MENSTEAPSLEPQKAKFGTADIVVLVVYFVFVLLVGIWIGASLMSSNVGSTLFVGMASSGASGGLAFGGFEWNATWVLIALGWIFMPVYIASGVITMPEYLKKRFGGRRIQMYMSVLSLLLYILTKISGFFVFVFFFLYIFRICYLFLSSIYTGGLTAVIYTDTLQAIIIVIGALTLTFISFHEVGWYPGLEKKYMEAIPQVIVPNTTCHLPRSDAFHMLRDPITGDLPWPGLIFGLTILSLFSWCNDQIMVQRSLSAKNLSHAKGGSILAGYLKLLPMFFVIMPGMISRALYPDEIGCVDPDECMKYCRSATGCANTAYPKLVITLLPVGLKGLMIAVIMAALMSSLTSIFNSASTIFTLDIWLYFRKNAKDRELVIVGRVCTAILVVISILWIPVIQHVSSGIVDYVQSINSYLTPPLTAIFILAIFFKRVNEQGAFWALIIGMLIGFIRMVMDFVYGEPKCGQLDSRPSILKDVHYLYFTIILFGLTTIVCIVISLCTPAIPEEQLARLTWWTREDPNQNVNSQMSSSQDACELTINSPQVEQKLADDIPQTEDAVSSTQEQNGGHVAPSYPWWKKLYYWLCGTSMQPKVQLTKEEEQTLQKKLTSIEEDPLWKNVCNINAVIVLAINVFLWGYFA
ncbi:sodium/glucose cotransporter 4-like [Rana temporaria]|uniref:sodium/glucose cotransporter 4-like n=1 Tax=Rana temporaria TaxID=8407 RepID=UPI001AADA085|nr:sodium/glucose cotransporter 4-like [Rana temporaria]